jgi:hypothetical protein
VQTKTMIIGAAAVAVALTGGIGATIASADTPSPAPSASPSTSPSTGAKDKDKADKKHRSLQARALHGEVTLAGKKHRVVDFQRGAVEKVSGTSLTVRSADGFTATYVVDGQTKVRKDKAEAQIADVEVGDKVRVVAPQDGSTSTAKRIVDRG